MKLIQWGIFAGLTVLIAALFHFIPRLRKRNLYFGVTVAEDFRGSEEGRAIAREFRVWVWAGTVLSLILLWVLLGSRQTLLFFLAANLQTLAGGLAWLRAWRRTRRHSVRPAGVRSAELVQGREVSVLGLLALVLPLLGPVAAAAFLWSKYSELPVRYPAHWGAAGHANRYVTKSPLAVFFPPLVSVLVLLLLVVIVLGIRFGTRRGTSGERAGWALRFRRLNLVMLTSIMWVASLTTSVLSVAVVLSSRTIGTLMAVGTVALLATVVGFAVALTRMSMEPTGGADATPDECWRGGMFYYNPADPAFMVESRDSMGFTFNFGNRLSWWFVVLLLTLVIGALILALGLK